MLTPGHQPTPATELAQLPALLHRVVAELADPAITYLLGGHYYDRTAHPRYRHFPAIFNPAAGRGVERGSRPGLRGL